MEELIKLAKELKANGKPLEQDELIHAALLVNNGWSAQEAINESIKTLKEGVY